MTASYDLVRLPNVLARLGRSTNGAWRRDSVVLCLGCFDFLHLGHVRHFQAARKLGGVLVVAVTPDRFVNKGPGRPAFPEDQRAEMVAALECVDYVAINEWDNAVPTIKLLRPAVYCKGADTRFNPAAAFADEKAAVEEVGGRLEFTDEVTYHSTDLLKMLNRPEDVYAEAAS